MIETVLKALQAVTLGFVVLVFGVLIAAPDFFGSRAQHVFSTLRKYDLALEFSTKGPKLIYSKSEESAAREAQTELDQIREDYACVVQNACTETQLSELSEILGIAPVLTESGTVSSAWIVIFGASETAEGLANERFLVARSGLETALYQRDGFFRAVASFTELSEAEANLATIRDVSGQPDAYIRSLGQWCATLEEVAEPEAFTRCGH